MNLSCGGISYTWIENWARIPATPRGRENGRTHGIAYSRTRDRFILFHQNDPAVVILAPDGEIESAWGADYPGAHGLTVAPENGREFLWLVDEKTCAVRKTTLDGEIVLEIQKPPIPAYAPGLETGRKGAYIPTWAAQHPATGEVWVADGYGSWLVHRYTASGDYVASLDGTEGAGPLRECHGIQFVPACGGWELFITDRANHRIAVYDDQGRFLRSGPLHSPAAFDSRDGAVLVPQLFGAVSLIDRATLQPIGALGANPDVRPNPDPTVWWPPVAPEGWPNLAGTPHIRPGVFSSPHGACFGPDGSVFVVEWIVGGRITKLQRA